MSTRGRTRRSLSDSLFPCLPRVLSTRRR
ncbi:hypothetical protein ANCDUO_21749 [Ancylostoma duodenale]|uniref:Uncharacterized protein n=1 Tax=Ancylostoma duodenale TaxID=51022 RepID=A0A0C2FHW6_9BILA|nr:hypothetical protein ANCDUO_21749 [Ancylostoma duodenale]